MRALAFAVLPFALCGLAAQRTLVVDPGGPYTQIAAAVAAAQPGDRIEVHPNPAAYEAFTVTFGLDIFAPQPGARVAAIDVANVAATHAVRIDGLELPPSPLGSFGGPGLLTVRDCAGIVHLHRVTAEGFVVERSPRVGISSCTATGALSWSAAPGFAGLALLQSAAAVTASSLTGGNGQYARADGGPGIALTDSSVVLAECTVQGGNGGGPSLCLGTNYFPGNGGAGVAGNAASTLRAVGTGSILGGRRGPLNGCYAEDGWGIGHGMGQVRVGPRVTVASGPVPPFPPIVPIPEPPHVLMPAILPLGTTVTVTTTDTADQFVLLGLDIWNDLVPVPGIELPFVLTAAATLHAFALPTPSNSTQFALAVPAAPWLVQQFVHLQVATVGNDGRLQLGSGAYGRIQ